MGQWNNTVENAMEKADGMVEILEQWLEDQDSRKEKIQFEEKAEREQIERERQVQFELKLFEAKMKLQYESTPEGEAHASGSDLKVEAKLPKLHTTKFNGTYGDWPRFWNLFSETIDKSSISPVNKFAYLQELLCEKAKRSMEALPHNSEGCNRAISILKDRFGKECEVVKTFVKEILELPHIATANTKKIHDFYAKLSYCVQSLETLKQLDAINGTVSMALDKLPAIRGDLVRNDSTWEKWNFVQFTETLQLWTKRNPLTEEAKSDDPSKKRDGRSQGQCYYQTQQVKAEHPSKIRQCIYCDSHDHRSAACTSVTSADQRKAILVKKKACFNSTGLAHRVSECRSTTKCKNCGKRHHALICGESEQPKPALAAHREEDQQVIYPTVLVEIDGVKAHALLDTGAGCTYASAKLIDAINKKPKQVMTRRVDMMLSSTTTKVEIYSANLKSIDGEFNMDIELCKVH